jgi:hypothetical protein
MKVAYLHGLESDPGGPKVEWLRDNFDKVYAPAMNYKNDDTFSIVFGEIRKMKPDFIIGSSMGGYFSYLIGKALGIPTVLFNPAFHSRSFDPNVTEFNGSNVNHLYLGDNDTVINPSKTKGLIGKMQGSFKKNSYKGGHRVPFGVFKNAVNKTILQKESINMESSNRIMLFEQWVKESEFFKGGIANGMSPEDLAKHHKISVGEINKALEKGKNVELEHTDDPDKAYEIAKDHIYEDPKYYDKLAKIEKE